MLQVTFSLRIVLLASMLVGVFGGASGLAVAAQATGERYTSPVSGVVIEATSPWVFNDGAAETGDAYDIVGLHASLDNLLIGFLPAEIEVEEAQAIVLDELATGMDGYVSLEAGSYNGVTYALDRARIGGSEFGIFSLFLEEPGSDIVVFLMYVGPVATFANGIASAQASVTLDGEPVLDGVEGDGLQGMLEVHSSSDGVADADAEQDATAETPAPDDRDDRRLPTDDTPLENESETGRRGRAPDLTQYESLGLVGQGEYVSPQYDTDIRWDDNWVFDTSLDEPIASDRREASDSLALLWNGDDIALFYVDIYASDGYTPADLKEIWASDEFLAETAEPEAEVLLQRSRSTAGAVLLRDYLSDGEEILLLREVISLDRGETFVVVTMIALPESFADAYADAVAGITIEGEPALGVFTQRQIEQAP